MTDCHRSIRAKWPFWVAFAESSSLLPSQLVSRHYHVANHPPHQQ